MLSPEERKALESFVEDNPAFLDLLKNPQKRNVFGQICQEDFDRITYVVRNPWIDLQKVVGIADNIMNMSPDLSGDDLLDSLCKYTAELMDAKGATCRTYDPIKQSMVAHGSYNWDVPREEAIPYEDSLAGQVMKNKNHYCVPDISKEDRYKEKEKSLSMGVHALLALPIQLVDFDGVERREVLIGTLQLYFEEKDKFFYPEQIKLIKTVVSRFSYVMAKKRNLELQKRSQIIRESRKAIFSILKRSQSLDQVLSFMVACIADTLGVHRCSLFSIEKDPSGNKFAILIAGYPLEPFAHRYGITLIFDEHPAFLEVYETGQPLSIDDAKNDPRMKASYDLYLNKKIENVYFFPLKDERGVVTNVLVLDGDETRPLERDDIFFCGALMEDIELCIQTSIRSQERHDFFNQMLSFGAIAKVYAKKVASPKTTAEDLNILYKKLYKSMLAVNDIISDRVPFAQKEQFDLGDVIKERLEAYYFPPQVSVAYSGTEPEIQIIADKKKVGRIVGNLLDNAHKKLGELKKGKLRVHTEEQDGYALIEIGNSGFIPPEVQETIMREYNQLTRNDSSEGRLGLSIVKLFTVMHNGVVDFESSAETNWTVFRVKLPLNLAER